MILTGVTLLCAATIWLPTVIVTTTQSRTAAGGQLSAAEVLNAENSVRTSLIQAFGGIILLIGIVLTTRQLRINRDQVAANWAQLELSRRTSLESFEATRQVQQRETFSRAVDQLGSESTTTRLGGAASLEQLAREDDQLRDIAVEILCAFIRNGSPLAHTNNGDADQEQQARWGRPSQRPPVDIQLALTALGRAWNEAPTLEELLRRTDRNLVDLSSTSLRGANLTLAHFEGALFRGSNLQEVNLSGSFCEGANFAAANCARANFAGNQMSGSYFSEASAIQADFHGTDLFMADLSDADLRGAQFAQANLTGSDLTNALLADEDGTNAANFRGAVADATTKWPTDFDPAQAGVEDVTDSASEMANSTDE